MKTQRLAAGIVLAYLASLVIFFAPPVAAQGEKPLVIVPDGDPTLSDNIKSGRLKPELDVASITFKFAVEVPIASGCLIPVTVQYTSKAIGNAASWSTLSLSTGSQSQTVSNGQAGGTPIAANAPIRTTGWQVTLTVTTKRDAPSFEDGVYEVTAHAKGGQTTTTCNVKDSEIDAKVPVTIKNDFVPRMVYEPSTYIIKSGQNRKVAFGLTMKNLGNGPTRVDTAATQTGKNKLDAVIPPTQQIILSKSQNVNNQNEVQTFITVQTPHGNGYTNTFYTIQADFKATYDNTAAQNAASDDKSLTLSVQVQGVYVPGFDAPSLIASLGVALLLVGLVRRKVA